MSFENVLAPLSSQTGLTWRLVGKDKNDSVVWNEESQDGYEVQAGIHWKELGEEEATAGTYAVCVEAFDKDGAQVTDGAPVVCHVLTMEGNVATAAAVHTLSAAEWLASRDTVGGTPIDSAVIDASGLGLNPPADEEEGEEAEEGEGDEAEEGEGDEAEEGEGEEGEEEADDAFQGDDDWGDDASEAVDEAGEDVDDAVDDAGDAVDDVDDAVDDAGDAVDGALGDGEDAINDAVGESEEYVEETVENLIPSAAYEIVEKAPGAYFQWYQPIEAKSYIGLRRYGAGNNIQVYNVAPVADAEEGADALSVLPVGEVVSLLGANMLAAGAIALGTITLTM